ncbi:mechanosensitive ion channel family protein [Sulfolobus acidocaldarius]|uniref:Conserved Archaeal protein n=4 Tax=Sulfolobus acidocaldarius TaxID=2285 RepID=Q4JC30_SULAC|nr:mechanosensitive ion channel family protein [Sulfolobus acidocaldarius]AAY79649.1 conserved Archaeal protein [Sulfolobus acidocaldarius DSM 639]AGE70205.1 hypothetical protein SacN8_01120 [Sulfolobus acidocaldarius N8]AGE72480.1 hypothetical protein SacRon12I_01120 [Sulfolobus acidocaldarius Ron12/I]ALU29386.1 hypothetical protein ATY89_05125 [Sulfolobus acidocaldarius]ALU32115.1 hypothetical protein ATZ20_08150 [Sulfolobus acidocaldarius]
MKLQKFIIILLSSIVAFGVINYILRVLQSSQLNNGIFTPDNILWIRLGLILALGFLLSWSLGEVVREIKIPNVAYQIATTVKILGYIITIVVAISTLGVSASTVLASGVFGGLVIGLALQPILGNFFAGILIILTRYITVGDQVRILSSQIPYGVASLPAYKYFSTERIDTGYKGTVVDIDLFFTRIITDDGNELRVPNLVVLNSSILDYTTRFSDQKVFGLRVEFPLSLGVEEIENAVNQVVKDYEVENGPYFNEQFDKEYVAVLVRIKVRNGEDWRKVKSEVLKRLLKVRQEMIIRQQKTQNNSSNNLVK